MFKALARWILREEMRMWKGCACDLSDMVWESFQDLEPQQQRRYMTIDYIVQNLPDIT